MDQGIDDLREEIESIDGGLLRMWEKRMYAALKAGVIRRDQGISVFDAKQQNQLWYNWQQQLDEDNADLAALLFHANSAAAELRQSRICRTFDPNIYLIGMPACGKAAVGQEAARRLQRGFCDTDQLVCMMFGGSLDEYDQSEELYHSRETAVLSALAGQPAGLIIAVGDGAVVSPINISLMQASGGMVLLQRESIDPVELAADVRPWCASVEQWQELWQERRTSYISAAAATVTADSIDSAATQLVDLLS